MATAVAGARVGRISINKASWTALVASWLGWMFDGYEAYALVLVMGIAVRQLLPPASLSRAPIYMGGLLAVTLLGWAVGGITAGVLADYIGRRRTLMLSILLYAVFAGMTALAPGYWFLLIFRFLTGLGLGAEWGPGAAIVAESWPRSTRGRAGGALHAAYGVGFLLASGVWLLVRPLGPSSWRYVFVIGVLPAFLILYVRRVVDDPALWVESNARRRDAQERVRDGRGSAHDRELVQFTIARTLSDPELRRRVLLLLLMAVSSVIGWWSVSTWVPEYAAEVGRRAGGPVLSAASVVLVFSLGAIAGCLVLGWLADVWGRKLTTWAYYLASLVLSLCFFLLAKNREALLLLAAANGFFASGQFAWMTIYLPELFPTRVRGSAMSLVFDSSRSVASVFPILAGWLISSFGGIGRAAAVMSLVYIVGLVVTPFAGPETKGQPLAA